MNIDIEKLKKDVRLFKSIGNARVKASQDLLDKIIKALEQQQAEIDKTCEWYRDSDDDDSYFVSSCNNYIIELIEGGIKENNMIYCNSCGGKIIETTHAEQEL